MTTTTFRMTPFMRRGTSILKSLLNFGVPMGPLMLLSVRGRRSGAIYTTPVAILRKGHTRWLVAAFGVTGWVHNLRASGEADLSSGRRIERVRVAELSVPDAAPILKEFLRQFGIIPFFKPYWTATAASPIDAFEREAGDHPVFRILGA